MNKCSSRQHCEKERLEQQLTELREAARKQHALLARFDTAPDVGKMLRDLHATLLKQGGE